MGEFNRSIQLNGAELNFVSKNKELFTQWGNVQRSSG